MSTAHYLFLSDKGNEVSEGDRLAEKAVRKLWKLIDQCPHAAGIKVESLRKLLADPEAFDA